MKKTAKPKGPASMSDATPGRVAAKRKRARKAEDDLAWPYSKSRVAHFDKVFNGATDSLAALIDANDRLDAHPDTAGMKRIEQALEAAHLDPVVHGSYELTRFVWFMRELLADFLPGMTLEQMLEPLETLLAKRHGVKGGRPPVEETWSQWRRRVELRRRSHPGLSLPEACGDIAAEWEEEGHAPVTGRTIQDAISKLKRREKLRS